MLRTAKPDDGVRRQLLAPALRNSSRSVLLLAAAVRVIAALAADAGRPLRDSLPRSWARSLDLAILRWASLCKHQLADQRQIDQAEKQLEANAALSGLLWAIGTTSIYPSLSGTTATTYVSMVFGSITVAAFFMTLVGRSFGILAGMQLSVLDLRQPGL